MERFNVYLIALVIALMTPISAQASTTLHLKAISVTRSWHSPNKTDPDKPLVFNIIINGHSVTGKGNVTSECSYSLFTRHLALELSNCGRSKVSVKYIGETYFTLKYQIGYSH